MIQCADPQCQVLQHIPCVIIPLDSAEEIPPVSSQHFCETCRINRCDPFWKSLAHALSPVKFSVSNIPDDGVSFRMQCPLYPDLKVNGMSPFFIILFHFYSSYLELKIPSVVKI